MAGQGRKRSVVTVGLVVVTCGLSWLGIRHTSVGADAAQLQAPRQHSVDDRVDSLPPSRFRKPGPLALAPVPGLTAAWHHAPEETAIPLGTVLRFFQPVPAGHEVTWTGARQVRREVDGSLAECPLNEIGMQEVRVEIVDPAKPERPPTRYAARLDVMDISVDDIQVAPIEASVDPVDLDENSTNEETVYAFFNVPSIAALRQVGDGLYRTSIDREIDMTVQVDPPGFAPLMEWRIDDGRFLLRGGQVRRAFTDIGTHTIAVGPPDRRQRIEIETYGVTITGQFEGDIPEGEPVIFEAVTDPPGFENDITWFSTTKFGTAVPVLGQGPTFTVQFDDTWGPHPDGGRWRWLGVKADNDVFAQDEKECNCPNPPAIARITFSTDREPPFICRININRGVQPCVNRNGMGVLVSITDLGVVKCDRGNCGPGDCLDGCARRWRVFLDPQGVPKRDNWQVGVDTPGDVCDCEWPIGTRINQGCASAAWIGQWAWNFANPTGNIDYLCE